MKVKSILYGCLMVVVASSCSSNSSESPDNESSKNDAIIMGAGSSFDYPLFSKMFYVYRQEKGQKVNYQSVGSGAGISQLTHKTVDFGATDSPMTESQEKEAGKEVLHIPITIGAVALSYNLPQINSKINLTGALVSSIFLGEITQWNDPKIKAENPTLNLPSTSIVVVHRSDGSGTTNIFTDYLSKVDANWKAKIGSGTAVKWMTGVGGKGNEGVAGLIEQTPGSIGYVGLTYAIQNKMKYAAIKNSSGKYIDPSIESVSAAADVSLPDDGKIFLTNTAAENGYPLAGFSWLIVYKDLGNSNISKNKAQNLAQLIDWMINEGQQYSKGLNYAPLSEKAVQLGNKMVRQLTFKGTPVLTEE